ncbi:MAG TPA: hypothetical protein PLB07_11715, partial [Bacteroidales bacterium]|nr:hypothetical protein [Bacteroidales bacterium]
MMKKLKSILVLIGLIAVIVLILMFNRKRTLERTRLASEVSTVVTVGIDVVKEEQADLSFSSNGSLEAFRELSFVSDVSGRVLEVFA